MLAGGPSPTPSLHEGAQAMVSSSILPVAIVGSAREWRTVSGHHLPLTSAELRCSVQQRPGRRAGGPHGDRDGSQAELLHGVAADVIGFGEGGRRTRQGVRLLDAGVADPQDGAQGGTDGVGVGLGTGPRIGDRAELGLTCGVRLVGEPPVRAVEPLGLGGEQAADQVVEYLELGGAQ